MKDHELEEMLWQALETTVGVEVMTSDVDALKRRLYTCRAKARERGNLEFDSIGFATPPFEADSKLWLVKLGRENGGVRTDAATAAL